jgi:hypothetical protein
LPGAGDLFTPLADHDSARELIVKTLFLFIDTHPDPKACVLLIVH